MCTRICAVVLSGILIVSQTAFGEAASERVKANEAAKAAMEKMIFAVNLERVRFPDAIRFLSEITNVNIQVNWKIREAGVNPDTPVTVKLRNVKPRQVLSRLLIEAGGRGNATWYLEDGIIVVTTQKMADEEMVTVVYAIKPVTIQSVRPPATMPSMIIFEPDGRRPVDVYAMAGYPDGGPRPLQWPGASARERGMYSGGREAWERWQAEQDLANMIFATVRPGIWAPVTGYSGIRLNKPVDPEKLQGKATLRFSDGKLVITAPRSVHAELMGAAD